MADIIQANYETLTAVAKRFGQQSNQIRQMHSRLQRQVALLRAAWVGKGSDAFFAETTDRVLPAVLRLSAALAEADRVTAQIAELLRGAEEQGASPFKNDNESGAQPTPFEQGSDSGGADASGGDAEGSGDSASDESGGAGSGVDGDAGAGVEGGDAGSEGSEAADAGGGAGGDAGGSWNEEGYQPTDDSDSMFDRLADEYSYGDMTDFGSERGWLGIGNEIDYAVPNDWLASVEEAFDGYGDVEGGLGSDGTGEEDVSTGSSDMGGGGGGEMDGGSGGDSAGEEPAENAGASEPAAGAMPYGGYSQIPYGGLAGGMGNDAILTDAGNQPAAVPAPLRYIFAAGAGGVAEDAAQPSGVTMAGVSTLDAAPVHANLAVPVGLAALAPLAALLGKAVKDRKNEQ